MEKASHASSLRQPIVQHDCSQLAIPGKGGYGEEDRPLGEAQTSMWCPYADYHTF
jgi:hypothetical protein